MNNKLNYKGKKLTLQQDAYISDYGDTYQASAKDEQGNTYKITWNVCCKDTDDESDACNWDDFTVTAN